MANLAKWRAFTWRNANTRVGKEVLETKRTSDRRKSLWAVQLLRYANYIKCNVVVTWHTSYTRLLHRFRNQVACLEIIDNCNIGMILLKNRKKSSRRIQAHSWDCKKPGVKWGQKIVPLWWTLFCALITYNNNSNRENKEALEFNCNCLFFSAWPVENAWGAGVLLQLNKLIR